MVCPWTCMRGLELILRVARSCTHGRGSNLRGKATAMSTCRSPPTQALRHLGFRQFPFCRKSKVFRLVDLKLVRPSRFEPCLADRLELLQMIHVGFEGVDALGSRQGAVAGRLRDAARPDSKVVLFKGQPISLFGNGHSLGRGSGIACGRSRLLANEQELC